MDIIKHINYENGKGIKYDTDEKFTIEDAAQEFSDWWKSTKDKEDKDDVSSVIESELQKIKEIEDDM